MTDGLVRFEGAHAGVRLWDCRVAASVLKTMKQAAADLRRDKISPSDGQFEMSATTAFVLGMEVDRFSPIYGPRKVHGGSFYGYPTTVVP